MRHTITWDIYSCVGMITISIEWISFDINWAMFQNVRSFHSTKTSDILKLGWDIKGSHVEYSSCWTFCYKPFCAFQTLHQESFASSSYKFTFFASFSCAIYPWPSWKTINLPIAFKVYLEVPYFWHALEIVIAKPCDLQDHNCAEAAALFGGRWLPLVIHPTLSVSSFRWKPLPATTLFETRSQP